MKRIIYLIAFLLSISFCAKDLVGQTYTLRFDGIDDYVNLGTETINGVRSIEMWFKPALDIDSTLSQPMTLIARENQGTSNEKEFYLSFVPCDWAGSGSLMFKYSYDMNTDFIIYSDTTFWEAGKWNHVAITLDYYEGMMMFINGQKQSDFYPLYDAIPDLNKITTIGCWGEELNRFFLGRIDDVRLAYNAIYFSDFEPPCPDIDLADSTAALYHFNEGSGYMAYDYGPNGYDADVNGSIFIMDSICINVGIKTHQEATDFIVFPNPFTESAKIKYTNLRRGILDLKIYDYFGRLLRVSSFTDPDEIIIKKGNLPAGIYILVLVNDNQYIDRNMIIIQ